ncbi:MAG: 50S ribosomal protein L23 [Rickettsiales bacterium]|nr:50S ribosomal protein L23 [Rickettsiales bacterium]|tara:strand:- start:47505 stop:47807 length:303 start_codon:yes stop_codon:yes gene_type:complete
MSISQERIFEIIRSPVISEKSTLISQFNQYVFKVSKTSTKEEIKSSIEKIFNVKVTSVNTLNQNGKIKRFKGKLGKRASTKKAIVTLAEGNSIDLTTGIK